MDVPSAVTVTLISCSGGKDSISSESDNPVAPSVTVCEPPDGALTLSLVPGEREEEINTREGKREEGVRETDCLGHWGQSVL